MNEELDEPIYIGKKKDLLVNLDEVCKNISKEYDLLWEHHRYPENGIIIIRRACSDSNPRCNRAPIIKTHIGKFDIEYVEEIFFTFLSTLEDYAHKSNLDVELVELILTDLEILKIILKEKYDVVENIELIKNLRKLGYERK